MFCHATATGSILVKADLLIRFFPPIAPTIKLAKLVKRTVAVNIKDTQRSKIDGYVATIYTPGEKTRNFQILKPSTRFFTFDYLFVNTTYVIEVISYKGRITSERSKAITITTETPGMSFYQHY